MALNATPKSHHYEIPRKWIPWSLNFNYFGRLSISSMRSFQAATKERCLEYKGKSTHLWTYWTPSESSSMATLYWGKKKTSEDSASALLLDRFIGSAFFQLRLPPDEDSSVLSFLNFSETVKRQELSIQNGSSTYRVFDARICLSSKLILINERMLLSWHWIWCVFSSYVDKYA